MNQKIKNHLTSFCKSMEMGTTETDFETVLLSFNPIQETKVSNEWGTEIIFTVVEIEGVFLGFEKTYNDVESSTTIDLSTVCEVEQKSKTIYVYEPKKDLRNIAVICRDSYDFNNYVRSVTTPNVFDGVVSKFPQQLEHDGKNYIKARYLEDIVYGQEFDDFVATKYAQDNENLFEHIIRHITNHCLINKNVYPSIL